MYIAQVYTRITADDFCKGVVCLCDSLCLQTLTPTPLSGLVLEYWTIILGNILHLAVLKVIFCAKSNMKLVALTRCSLKYSVNATFFRHFQQNLNISNIFSTHGDLKKNSNVLNYSKHARTKIPVRKSSRQGTLEVKTVEINYSGGHDDVIKWKHFPRHWPFLRRIHR